MRKRSGRRPRYAAVPNETIDDAVQLDFMALALLTILLRHRDGWDITLAEIGAKYGYGRDAMANAMGLLQAGRYVVKIRLMSAQNNQWSTEVCVYDTPATDAEIQALLAQASREPDVRVAQVIEPTKAALEHASKRRSKLQPKGRGRVAPTVAVPRVPESPDSGPTCVDAGSSQVAPDCGDSRQSGDPAVFKKTVVQKTMDETGVPSARSAVGVRSTSSSGSSEAGDGSGFAAAAKESSASDQEDGTAGVPGQRKPDGPELSREQLAAVRSVEALLPPVLRALLPYQQFPGRNRPVVLEAIESRTLEQIRERVERRWVAYRYEPAVYDDKMPNPIGAALELIRPPRYCPDLSCEDGTLIDTGAECRSCLQRLAARRAARAAGQLVLSSSKGNGSGRLPECVICQAPFPGAVPDSGECLGCEKEAERAFEALSARLEPSETAWEAPEPEDTLVPPEDVQEAAGVDEETARLRDYYARQFGTPEQVEAYCANAPF